MDYFGDESGHLKGVLQGDCEVCVYGVVGGIRIDCVRCANRAVRNVQDIDEAKWNDLLDTQKRRLIDCFAEQDLEFGYALFTRDSLHSIDYCYYMHDDRSIPPAWDLALAGYSYGEILYEMGAHNKRRGTLTFDKVASNKQSKALARHAREFVELSCFPGNSKDQPGIQAADCFAGAVAEDHKNGTDWLDSLDGAEITECSSWALTKLEADLSRL